MGAISNNLPFCFLVHGLINVVSIGVACANDLALYPLVPKVKKIVYKGHCFYCVQLLD